MDRSESLAIGVVAAAPEGDLWGSAAAWYIDELVVGPERAPGGWRSRSFVASPLHPRLVVEAVHPDSTTEGINDA